MAPKVPCGGKGGGCALFQTPGVSACLASYGGGARFKVRGRGEVSLLERRLGSPRTAANEWKRRRLPVPHHAMAMCALSTGPVMMPPRGTGKVKVGIFAYTVGIDGLGGYLQARVFFQAIKYAACLHSQ